MKLIDGDTLYEIIELMDTDIIKTSKTARFLLEQVLFDIKRSPIIGIVKHGEWINHGSYAECSICHEEQYGHDNFRGYCASCGAKMEKETEGQAEMQRLAEEKYQSYKKKHKV